MTRESEKKELLTVTIDALAYGGAGVGRSEGRAVFVPYTAPGDVVSCRVLRSKPRMLWAESEELRVEAPERVLPPCPLFGVCGGCHWQHLDYESQLSWKERLFADMLTRHAKVPENVFAPIVPSPVSFGYRQRMQFKCHVAPAGLCIGLYRGQSHFVVDAPQCLLAAPTINEALALLRARLADFAQTNRIPQMDISCDEEGVLRVLIHFLAEDSAALERHLKPLALERGWGLFVQCGRNETRHHVCGPSDLAIKPLENAHSLRLAYPAGSFAQINAAQNRRLVAELLETSALRGGEMVLDLFCGVGNLTLPLALRARRVVGVEGVEPAVTAARDNARANGIANAEFVAADANGAFPLNMAKVDVAVLDPPREGAAGAVKRLLELRPELICYVSCDPSTLARDLVPLQHGGYEVVRARAFDFFPQTFHIEGLVVLRRI